MYRATVIALLALVSATSVASSQRSAAAGLPRANTQKLFVGVMLSGTGIEVEDLNDNDDREDGGGGALQLGYGFSRLFSLYLEGNVSVIEVETFSFGLAHFDVMGRFSFTNPRRALVPFVDVGFSGWGAGSDNAEFIDENGNQQRGELAFTGGGFTFGGGIQYFVAPAWALNLGLKFTAGEFTTFEFENVSIDGLEIDATTSRLSLGFTWHPMLGARR